MLEFRLPKAARRDGQVGVRNGSAQIHEPKRPGRLYRVRQRHVRG